MRGALFFLIIIFSLTSAFAGDDEFSEETGGYRRSSKIPGGESIKMRSFSEEVKTTESAIFSSTSSSSQRIDPKFKEEFPEVEDLPLSCIPASDLSIGTPTWLAPLFPMEQSRNSTKPDALPKGYPDGVHGILEIFFTDPFNANIFPISQLAFSTLWDSHKVLVSRHHFKCQSDSRMHVSKMNFYHLKGEKIVEQIAVKSTITPSLDVTLMSSNPKEGAHLVELEKPIKDQKVFLNFFAPSENFLSADPNVFIVGLFGSLNLEALRRGKRYFFIGSKENKIIKTETCEGVSLIGVRDKPELSQQGEIVVFLDKRIGRFSIGALGRGEKKKEDIFHLITDSFLRKLEYKNIDTKKRTAHSLDEGLMQRKFLPMLEDEALSEFVLIPKKEEVKKSEDSRAYYKNDFQKENLADSYFWYIKAPTVGVPILLLKCLEDVHPVFSIMGRLARSYRQTKEMEAAFRTKDLLRFFKWVLSIAHSSFEDNKDKSEQITLSLPPEEEIKSIGEAIAEKEEGLKKLGEKIKRERKKLQEMDNDSLTTLSESEITKLTAEEKKIKEQLEHLEHQKNKIQESFRILANQENPQSSIQNQMDIFENPEKWDIYLRERFRELKNQANLQNVEAMQRLGQFYLWGLGTRQDGVEALNYLAKAAQLGDAKANEIMGLLYEGGFIGPKEQKNSEELEKYQVRKAEEYYNKLAEKDGYGYLHLARLYFSRENAQAMRFLRLAEQKGNHIALWALAKSKGIPGGFSDYPSYQTFLQDIQRKIKIKERSPHLGWIDNLAEGEVGTLPLLSEYYFFDQRGESRYFLSALSASLYDLSHESLFLQHLVSLEEKKDEGVAVKYLQKQVKEGNFSSFLETLINKIFEKRGKNKIDPKVFTKFKKEEGTEALVSLIDAADFSQFQQKLSSLFIQEDSMVLRSAIVDILIEGEARERYLNIVKELSTLFLALEILKDVEIDRLLLLAKMGNFDDCLRELQILFKERRGEERYKYFLEKMKKIPAQDEDSTLQEEVKKRFKVMVDKVAHLFYSSAGKSCRFTCILKQLEELSKKKFEIVTKNCSPNVGLFHFLYDKVTENDISARQCLGHYYLWKWNESQLQENSYQKEEEKPSNFIKAAVTFRACAVKKNDNYWRELCSLLESEGNLECSAILDLLKKDAPEQWLEPITIVDQENLKECIHRPNINMKRISRSKIEDCFKLATAGYSMGYFLLGRYVMLDAPTLAATCFSQDGHPEMLSSLGMLHYSVEFMGNLNNNLEKNRKESSLEKRKRRQIAYQYWTQAELKDSSTALYCKGMALYKEGKKEKEDNKKNRKLAKEKEEKGIQLLHLAKAKGYNPVSNKRGKMDVPKVLPDFRTKELIELYKKI